MALSLLAGTTVATRTWSTYSRQHMHLYIRMCGKYQNLMNWLIWHYTIRLNEHHCSRADKFWCKPQKNAPILLLYYTNSLFLVLLAHLSQRLIGELIVYQWLRRPSVRRPSTFSNISSETNEPIELLFHMETP